MDKSEVWGIAVLNGQGNECLTMKVTFGQGYKWKVRKGAAQTSKIRGFKAWGAASIQASGQELPAIWRNSKKNHRQVASCIAGQRRSGETMRGLLGLCNSLTFTWRWSQRRDLSRRVSGCNLCSNVSFCQAENRPHLGIVKLMYFCNNYVLCLNIKIFLFYHHAFY